MENIIYTTADDKKILYKNRKGYNVRTHSYSAGQDFKSCQRLYQLKRVQGWKEKEKRAAMVFGQAIEDAVQWFHNHDCEPESAEAQFQHLWTKQKDEELVYTDREGGWEDMLKMGTDMMVLYELKLPTLPIKKPKFQLNYRKVVFPGTPLANIEFTAYIDMLIESPEGNLVLDIKTTGAALPDIPNILSLDPQLRTYAWVTGVPDVGFLVFLKVRPDLRVGDAVTVLGDTTIFKAGDPAIIVDFVEGLSSKLPQLMKPLDYTCYETAVRGTRGKSRDAAKRVSRGMHPVEGVPPGLVTKQQLQFATAHINPEAIKAAGEAVGQQIVGIIHATETQNFPQDGAGVRFPHNQCVSCPCLGICTDNKELRDSKLEQINRSWIDELEEGA